VYQQLAVRVGDFKAAAPSVCLHTEQKGSSSSKATTAVMLGVVSETVLYAVLQLAAHVGIPAAR
jgi:hypothetical protein